jgi:hypothetical protein
MSEEVFSLPISAYDVITKILHAYVLCGNGKVSLNDVASRAGMNRTLVSGNNAFLVSIGLLDKGRDKQLTPVGRALAVALGNGIVDDIRRCWRDVLTGCTATKSVIDMMRIQKTISENDIQGRVASCLGVVAAGAGRTGINTLVDLFVKAEVVELVDGAYRVRQDTGAQKSASEQIADMGKPSHSAKQQPEIPILDARPPQNRKTGVPTIHVDLEIHISPESTPEQIDKVFECIAKHLYGRSIAE